MVQRFHRPTVFGNHAQKVGQLYRSSDFGLRTLRTVMLIQFLSFDEKVSIAVHRKLFQSATCHHPTQQNAPNLTAFTLEGWKAELTCMFGYIARWFTCSLTHPKY